MQWFGLLLLVLENMCGQVNTVGGNFLELRRIINRINDKSRIGVCLDTCHAFAAGNFFISEQLDDVARQYLCAVTFHLFFI
jgi:deoxyribonuclease IV